MRASGGRLSPLRVERQDVKHFIRLAAVLGGLGVAVAMISIGSATHLTWDDRADMPTARRGLSVVAGADGKIYTVAGNVTGGITAALEVYDPATDSWATKTALPAARVNQSAALDASGKIHVISGWTGAAQSGEVFVYDPASDTWDTSSANLPSPRSHARAATAPSGKIYVMGGETSAGSPWSCTNLVHEYDPGTDSWSAKGPMPSVRCSFGMATATNGKIYVVGGITDSANTMADAFMHEYDPATDSWTQLAAMPGGARAALALVGSANGRLYAIGGFDASATQLDRVEEYDPSTDTWSANTPINLARADLGAAEVANRIYAIGGWHLVSGVMTFTARNERSIIDHNKPTVALVSAVTLPDNAPYVFGSWTNKDVKITLSCVDAETGVLASTVTETYTAEMDTTVSVNGSPDCEDLAGNVADPITLGPIRIDKTKPVVANPFSENLVNYTTRTPYLLNTWTKYTVVVTFTCSDALSGLKPGSQGAQEVYYSMQTYGAQVHSSFNQAGQSSCTDRAGNVADELTVGDIKIDRTPPVVTYSIPAPNANGWHKTDVLVAFACTDPNGIVQSGIAIDTVPDYLFGAGVEGTGLKATSTGDCIDNAGNRAIPLTTNAVKIDRTPPVCTISTSPRQLKPANNALINVTVSVTVKDTLSGKWFDTLTSVTGGVVGTEVVDWDTGTSDKAGRLKAMAGKVYTFAYSATDLAGNSAVCTPSTPGSHQVTVP